MIMMMIASIFHLWKTEVTMIWCELIWNAMFIALLSNRAKQMWCCVICGNKTSLKYLFFLAKIDALNKLNCSLLFSFFFYSINAIRHATWKQTMKETQLIYEKKTERAIIFFWNKTWNLVWSNIIPKDHENRGKKGNELRKRNSKHCYLNCTIIMIIMIQFQRFFNLLTVLIMKNTYEDTDTQTLFMI